MTQPPLPLQNPYDWMTVAAVAEMLRVDRRTVERMVERGILNRYQPYQAKGEKPCYLMWRADVVAVRDARNLLAASGAGQ